MAENFDTDPESEENQTKIFEKMKEIKGLTDLIDKLFESFGEKAPSNLTKEEVAETEKIRSKIFKSKRTIEKHHKETDQKMKV